LLINRINITDIPEWCVAESFGEKMNWNLTGDHYKQMFEHSPMRYPPKIPVMLVLGAKDKRVPY
jgi:acylaminoacyl-peptidase